MSFHFFSCSYCNETFQEYKNYVNHFCYGFNNLQQPKESIPMSEKGKKFDQEKPDLSLIPREPLWELARVLMAGEKKYGRWNWQQGLDVHRLTSAAMRHITQFNDGEDIDEETKTNHLLNACANLFFAHWMLLNKPEHDTRPKKNK